jgi:hypothetical protein
MPQDDLQEVRATPGPWHVEDGGFGAYVISDDANGFAICQRSPWENWSQQSRANAKLIAAAPDLLAALKAVNKLIAEAAMTGFNYLDGDWAERLFTSQQATSAAIRKAEGEA